ncbi:MAG: hypothetical protein ACOX1F_06530 [Erysipelotrichaceae bacterium]|jgi:hypothetical protein
MKKYIYKKDHFFVRVTLVGIICIIMGAYNSYLFIKEKNILNLFIVVVCVYQIFNTFFSLSNPQEVYIDDHRITFKAYGQVHSYDFKQIYDFRVKEFPQAKKVYLRINKNQNNLLKGRYWVFCLYFNDSDELFRWFLDKEYQMHPDTIKAHARRSNEMSPEEKEKCAQLKTEKEKNKKRGFFTNKKMKKGESRNGCL